MSETPPPVAAISGMSREKWHDLVMEASSEGIYHWDIRNDRLTVSVRLTGMLGLAPGTLGAAEWNERIHPEDFPAYARAVEAHLKGDTRFLRCEYRVRHKSGDFIWFADNGKCVRNETGWATNLVGAVADVTERKRTEAALARSEERYALAMRAVNEGIYDWNIETDEIFYSEGVHEVLGFGPEELKTAQDWAARIHPDDMPQWRAALLAHFRGEAPRFAAEFRYRGPAGEWRWARQHGLAVFNEDGRAVRMIGATGDITDLKRTELALRESEERYALATRAATEGLYDWDVASDSLLVSERLNRIMELPSGRLNSVEWNERVHPADRERYHKTMVAHFRGETERFTCEYRVRNGGGEHIWVKDNATSLRDAEGRVTRLVGAIADIGARKQAEADLREARQRAEDASLLAVEKAQMLETLSNKLAKYLSPQVYSSIFSGKQDVQIEAKRKKLTIFFSDIVGFTSIADMLESEELTELLNDYLTEMSRIALEHGATIDKFIGDAILAFFGDPDTRGVKEDAIACVRMAVAMQRRMREMQVDWRERGLDRTFELRIGITTGYCTVGNFGSEDRMDYTVVGNEVNRAARLQALADSGGILLSSETQALVKDEIATVDRGVAELKGIPRPVQVYQVLGIYDDMAEAGEIIRFAGPGVSLFLHQAALASDSREQALQALERAISEIRRAGDDPTDPAAS